MKATMSRRLKQHNNTTYLLTQDDALPLPFFLNSDYDMSRLGKAQIPTILLQGALLCCVGSIESLMTAQAGPNPPP